VIRAVTLDCWGTLLIDGPASDDRYRRQRLSGIRSILARNGFAAGPTELDRAYAESGRWLARRWQYRRDAPVGEHVNALLRALDRELPAHLSSEAIVELVGAYANPALQVPPALDEGAGLALMALAARGLVLGLVSNTMRTPGVVLRRVFDKAGVLAPFTVLTFSDECGIRKPDPEIFRLTLRALGVSAEHAVHVGDDPVLDVEGARDAGMRGVIQIAADLRATGAAKPDAVIRSLAELPAALGRLAS
jgi:putative hydrolase of the HAD superfamily